MLDVLLYVERIQKPKFTLDGVYAFESVLQARHPLNRNVRAKTQSGQQLQFLRDKGLVRFVGGWKVSEDVVGATHPCPQSS